MSYSKGDAAKFLGTSRQGLAKMAEKAGFDSTEEYFNSIGGYAYKIVNAIKKEIVALNRQLKLLGPIGLTDEEKEGFLQKAIQEVQPYYDRKSAEISEQIKEGKVRTAEDTLVEIRQVEEEVSQHLEYYDLTTAETEEDFINRIADITATEGEDIALKTDDWRQRIENVKLQQIQSGTFSSGIGAKKRKEEEARKALELGSVQRKAQSREAEAEDARKYDIEKIRLARETAQQDRIRRIGTPQETEATKQQGLQTLGLGSLGELGSAAELERARKERGFGNITADKYSLAENESSRKLAEESRKIELQEGEKAVREQERQSQREEVLAEAARKKSQLSRYGVYA